MISNETIDSCSTNDFSYQFLSIQEQDKKLQALWNACEKLPKANHNNIR